MGERGDKTIVSGIIFSILPTVFVLGLLIFVHELGHFLTAKFSGVTVEKFSIGFGPEIFSFTKNNTVYSISLLPIGGFVKMAGETFEEREGEHLHAGDFLAQNIGKRFAILFAGSFMNYVTAFFLLVAVCLIGAPTIGTMFGAIRPDSPAFHAGFVSEDKVLSINGVPVQTWISMTDMIQDSSGKELMFQVQRDGQEMNLAVVPEKVESKDLFGDVHALYQIGVASGNEILYTEYGFFEAWKEGFRMLMDLTALTYKSIFRLVTGRLSMKVMSGPLGIVDMASKAARSGLAPLLQLTAYIAVFLAVFNLLPFPALDGGHLFFLLIEAIFRKPVSFHLQERLSQVGLILLMCLMVFVVYNDIDRFGWIGKIKNLFF